MPDKLKIRVVQQMPNIILRTSKQIIYTNDVIALLQESITEVRAQKTGSSGDQYSSFSHM